MDTMIEWIVIIVNLLKYFFRENIPWKLNNQISRTAVYVTF